MTPNEKRQRAAKMVECAAMAFCALVFVCGALGSLYMALATINTIASPIAAGFEIACMGLVFYCARAAESAGLEAEMIGIRAKYRR